MGVIVNMCALTIDLLIYLVVYDLIVMIEYSRR